MTSPFTPRAGLKSFSGQKVIEASLAKIAQVLTDVSSKTEWLSGLVEERLIEAADEAVLDNIPKHCVVYQHYTLMPMVKDREYIIACAWETESNQEGEVVRATMTQASTEHQDVVPDADRVVAALHNITYVLTPEGDATKVDVSIQVDPLGNFPIFAVNLYGSSWCDKNLTALAGQCKK